MGCIPKNGTHPNRCSRRQIFYEWRGKTDSPESHIHSSRSQPTYTTPPLIHTRRSRSIHHRRHLIEFYVKAIQKFGDESGCLLSWLGCQSEFWDRLVRRFISVANLDFYCKGSREKNRPRHAASITAKSSHVARRNRLRKEPRIYHFTCVGVLVQR